MRKQMDGEFYDDETPARGRSNRNKDLVLAPGEYAYVQELTKGTIQVLVGPVTFSPTAQHQAVVYQMKGKKSFNPVGTIEEAVQKAAIAVEGMYLQLLNPTMSGNQPEQGHAASTPELQVGRKVNIPGPCMFPLWPGQTVKLIKGHTLRSNQYLLVKVYNEDEARDNWSSAVVKSVGVDGSETDVVTSSAPADLTVGKHYIVRGTEVSFYIPPTGVSVVTSDDGEYVREALTLERLEYSILVNEGGDKRYERGPAVVFPEPNEDFIVSPKGAKKFRAIELNDIQGIYVKVTSEYTEDDGTVRALGDEIFITGKDTPIYFPREEHSLVKYDNKTKHFATAIPSGEGRYVMNRTNGTIAVVKGPAMSLPDPRSEVFVVRRLTDSECELWYPGNSDVLAWNSALVQLEKGKSATRGAISEGQLRKGSKGVSKSLAGSGLEVGSTAFLAQSSIIGNSAQSFMPDEFSRGSSYTAPRSITLNTKFQGVPIVQPFTGYAVQIVSADGRRRIVEGPARLLMEYDETLDSVSLSTGNVKNTSNPLKTAYLRVKNNRVSDTITVETSDHVKVSFKVNFLADFTGDSSKWFDVENYVKLLCDHARSMLAAAAKQLLVADLYQDGINFARDTILGEKSNDGRTGLSFSECGLHVRDVEVLDVIIRDGHISDLLDREQHNVVSENIALERERRTHAFTVEHEGIQRAIKLEQQNTVELDVELQAKSIALQLGLALSKIDGEIKMLESKALSFEAGAAADKVKSDSKLLADRGLLEQRMEFSQKEQEQKIALLVAEAAASIDKAKQFGPQFASALTTLSNNETMEKVAKALSVQQLLGGTSAVDVITQTFSGFPGLEDFMKRRGWEAAMASKEKSLNSKKPPANTKQK